MFGEELVVNGVAETAEAEAGTKAASFLKRKTDAVNIGGGMEEPDRERECVRRERKRESTRERERQR